MREIIFRGKRADNGEWVYGSLITERNMFDGNLMTMHIQDIEEPYDDNLIDDETVGQFTGLTDKNGLTKIFEGDIIQDSNYPEYVFRIEYHNGTIIASEIHTFDKVYLDNFICFNIFEAFVIGNVHDNPELLEGKA